MSRVAWLLVLGACVTEQAVVRAAPPPPPAPPPSDACPTTAPSGAPFAPETVFGSKVEKLCLIGAGDETSLRLREAVAPREGTTLDAEGVRSDLTALVDTGLISQASVFAQPLEGARVVVTYVVVERAVISAVRLEGAPSLPADVRQQVEGRNFRDTPGQRDRRRDLLTDFYEAQGFHDAAIAFRTEGNELLVSVSEGARFVVEAVRFEGAKAVAVKELEKTVDVKVGAAVRPERLEVDVMKLTGLYFDRGHAMVKVTSQRRPHGATPGPTDVTFTIVEGPLFRVGVVSLKGGSLGTKALAGLETKKGAVFSRAVIARDLERLRELGRKQGKDLEVLPLTELDQEKHTIGLTFELTERH